MKKKLLSLLLVPTMLAATLTVCASAEKSSDTAAVFNAETKPATQSTIEVNRQVYDFLTLRIRRSLRMRNEVSSPHRTH